MKKYKILSILCVFILSIYFCVCMIAGCSEPPHTDENDTPKIFSEDFIYELSNDESYFIITGLGTYSNQELVIPNEFRNKPVKEISKNAFYSCSLFTSAIIPDSINKIGEASFYNCDNLLSITIGSGVETIDNGAFADCKLLRIISVSNDNLSFKSMEGNLYSKDEKKLIQYANGKADMAFVIPNNVTNVGAYAFFGCTKLTHLTIGANVEAISPYAFANCVGLEGVVFNDKLNTIGPHSFYNCPGLTEIILPNSLERIYFFAFQKCVRLEKIVFDISNSWYRTQNEKEFKNKEAGIVVDITNPSLNANYLESTYTSYFWYKKTTNDA